MMPDTEVTKFPEFETDSEFMKDLTDIDKEFVLVQQGIAAVNAMNAVETQIAVACRMIRECFVDAPTSIIQIIVARLADVKAEEIDKLSMGFIIETLTVEDKKYDLKLPSHVESQFPPNLKDLDELTFSRAVIALLKRTDEQVATSNMWLNNLRKNFNEKISEKVKHIIATPDSLHEYTMYYYKTKLDSPDLPEEQRAALEKTLKYAEYAVTLEPIFESIKTRMDSKKSSSNSILYGYKNQFLNVMKAAEKACRSNNLSFPRGIITNIEEKFFGKDMYKNYPGLLAFIVARHIKFNSNMSKYDKVFLANLLSYMLQIARSDENDDKCKNLKDDMRPNVKKLLDLVINGN